MTCIIYYKVCFIAYAVDPLTVGTYDIYYIYIFFLSNKLKSQDYCNVFNEIINEYV